MVNSKMSKNILIIDSSNNGCGALSDLLIELKNHDYNLYFALRPDPPFKTTLRENNWPNKKIYLGPNISGSTNPIIGVLNLFVFWLILPCLYFKALLTLWYYKYIIKITTIICWNWNEKLLFTPVSRMVKIKVIWIECPETNSHAKPGLMRRLYRWSAKWATIICFTEKTRSALTDIGCRSDSIKLIGPGIKLKNHQRQETIFNTLAQVDYKKLGRKFFTVGTMAALNKRQNIEILLRAIKKSLSVVSNLQLTIVGDGPERKRLMWLAKKIEVDNITWFVGEQGHSRKWLDNFDIFVVTVDTPRLKDIKLVLRAMAAGLPVIGPKNAGLDNVITENKTGFLFETQDNEALARHIIALEQKNHLRAQLGKNAREIVDKKFNLDKMAAEFEKLI